jgi:RNA polymerase sigma-70 factor (ECF subfamily)
MAEVKMNDSPPIALTPDQEARAIEAARRDPAAFARLYRAYVRPIYRYLYSRVGQAGDAEDLTSQVFLEALQSLSRYRHRGHFPAWLFAIARHRLLNFRYRGPLETGIEAAERRASAGPDPLVQVLRAEERDRLLALIGDLREDEQDLLRLRFTGELSFSEIGELLGRSEDAVKKQVYRLLARLESQLESDHDEQ